LSELTVQVFGYGAEVGHIEVSKEAYTWWKQTNEEDEDALVSYLNSWELSDYEGPEVPKEAEFLRREEGKKVYWADSENLIDQYWQQTAECSSIKIEVDGKSVFAEDDTSPAFSDVVIGDADDTNNKDIAMSYTCSPYTHNQLKEAVYVITFESSEKGMFIDAVTNIDSDFDKSKLVFYVEEDWSGNSTIAGVDYNGEDFDTTSEPEDTVGKGIYAHVWKSGEE
jgi:hypothetical protein